MRRCGPGRVREGAHHQLGIFITLAGERVSVQVRGRSVIAVVSPHDREFTAWEPVELQEKRRSQPRPTALHGAQWVGTSRGIGESDAQPLTPKLDRAPTRDQREPL